MRRASLSGSVSASGSRHCQHPQLEWPPDHCLCQWQPEASLATGSASDPEAIGVKCICLYFKFSVTSTPAMPVSSSRYGFRRRARGRRRHRTVTELSAAVVSRAWWLPSQVSSAMTEYATDNDQLVPASRCELRQHSQPAAEGGRILPLWGNSGWSGGA